MGPFLSQKGPYVTGVLMLECFVSPIRTVHLWTALRRLRPIPQTPDNS